MQAYTLSIDYHSWSGFDVGTQHLWRLLVSVKKYCVFTGLLHLRFILLVISSVNAISCDYQFVKEDCTEKVNAQQPTHISNMFDLLPAPHCLPFSC